MAQVFLQVQHLTEKQGFHNTANTCHYMQIFVVHPNNCKNVPECRPKLENYRSSHNRVYNTMYLQPTCAPALDMSEPTLTMPSAVLVCPHFKNIYCMRQMWHSRTAAKHHIISIRTQANNWQNAVMHAEWTFMLANELPLDKTNTMIYAPSEDSDHPGHPPSLIRVFAVHSMGS